MPTNRPQDYETTDRRQRGKRENQRPDHWQSPTAGRGWQSGVSNAIQAKSNQIKRGPKILQEITERTFNRLFNSGKPFLHHSAPLFAPFAGTPAANQRLTIGNCTRLERQDYRPSFPSFAYVGNPRRAFPHHAPCVQAQSTLQSNLKITPVKPGQTWSNLKLFPRNNPRARRTTHHAPPRVAAR